MNAEKVEQYIRKALQDSRQFNPRQIYKNISVGVYSGSFGSITIRIASDWGYSSGYVANYSNIDDKIADFLHRGAFNLYEAYYRKHHQKRRAK